MTDIRTYQILTTALSGHAFSFLKDLRKQVFIMITTWFTTL